VQAARERAMAVRIRRRSVDGIPQASLADIAFLLLIFFIATTTFAIERGLPLLLPSARQSTVLEVEPEDVFRIEGHADGRVVADGETVPVGELAGRLRRRNAARREAGAGELIVLIETDPRADYSLMVDILDQVRSADSRRIALKLLGEG
jgi:biopolymer transport protein ExbD